MLPFGTTIVLGAIAGFTIYCGLPVARLKNPPRTLQAMLNAIATGILIFLFFDVIKQASEPINSALDAKSFGAAFGYAALMAVGLGIGSLGLVFFEKRFMQRKRLLGPGAALAASMAVAPGVTSSRDLATMIATGIGLHNFSEGLAIGLSAATGHLALAVTLIIGFSLHNATEGFGIAAPISAAGECVSWKMIVLLGLIGGGPTFLGTMVGYGAAATTPEAVINVVSILFLALAAGAIIYVVNELLHVGRKFAASQILMGGLLIGFVLGYVTDMIVTIGGA